MDSENGHSPEVEASQPRQFERRERHDDWLGNFTEYTPLEDGEAYTERTEEEHRVDSLLSDIYALGFNECESQTYVIEDEEPTHHIRAAKRSENHEFALFYGTDGRSADERTGGSVRASHVPVEFIDDKIWQALRALEEETRESDLEALESQEQA